MSLFSVIFQLSGLSIPSSSPQQPITIAENGQYSVSHGHLLARDFIDLSWGSRLTMNINEVERSDR